MSDTYLIFIVGIVATVAQAIFWKWVQGINDERKADRAKIELLGAEIGQLRSEVYRNYQSKSDAHIDNQRILESLNDLKADVKELGHKLDKKADK